MKKFLLISVFFAVLLYGEIDKSIRNLGCLIEDPTKIDWIYPSPAPTVYFGKASVDHSAYLPPVGNQGAQGSCVAWSTAYYYKTYMLKRKHGESWNVTQTQFQMSPSFMYNLINGGRDGGAYISDGFKCLSDIGCASLLDKPYNQYDSTTWGSEIAFGKAGAYRGDTTYYINITTDAGINQLKNILQEGFCAVIGITVYTQFWYGNFGADTVYDTQDKIGNVEGGHAVCIVGFNDEKTTVDGSGAVKIVNSWGTSWGPGGGFFYMSYQALKDQDLCDGYAYYQVEKKDFNTLSKGSRFERYYDSQLRVRYKINHPRRERIQITLRYPKLNYNRTYFNWGMLTPAANAYPNYYISLDFSDFVSQIDPYNFDDTIMVIVRDITTDGNTGTLDGAYIENVNWGTYSLAYDLPKSIPDNGRCTTWILIEKDRTYWPSFHGMLTNDGSTFLSSNKRNFSLIDSSILSSEVYTPVLADINKDGNIDIVVATKDGYVYAYTGEHLNPLWSFGPTYTNILSHPVIGDIQPNDTLDVIINAGDSVYILKGTDGSVIRRLGPGSVNYTSSVVTNIDGDVAYEIITVGETKSIRVYNGATGTSKWYFPTSGVYPVRTTPAIGDIDCNGIPDIVFTSVNGSCYAARRLGNATTGTLVWSYATGDSIFSSPVISNIDSTGGNGRYEVIFGSDDGYLYVLNYDGTLKWRYYIGSKIRSTPSVCDIDGNMFKEIIVGADDGNVYFFDYQGNLLRTYNCGGMIRSSPVLVDIDGDNIKEIIVPSTNGNVYAIKFADASLIWRISTDGEPTTPALGDINNDGDVDIVIGTSNGKVYVYTADPYGIPENSFTLKINTNILNNKVKLSYFVPEDGVINIKILDISGRVVGSYNGFETKGENIKEFDISSNGIYFVIMNNYNRTTKDKFIFIK